MPRVSEVLVGLGMSQAADPKRHQEDETRWLGVKDYSIFLNDGVLRSFGLVPCPFITKSDGAISSPSSSTEIDIQNLKNSSSKTAELQERLLKLCSTSPAALRRYHNFHFNIFQAMWLWKYKNASKLTESVKNLKKNQIAQVGVPSSALMASKLSLLFLVPLLKSQSAMDTDLATNTAQILFGLLLELPGMSFCRELQAPLDQLEVLFGEWIQERGETFQEVGMSVIVGLSCARGSLSSILKTISLLQGHKSMDTFLPVRNILQNLPNLETRIGKACQISASRHVSTWQYDDELDPPMDSPGTTPPSTTTPATNNTVYANEKTLNWHGLATDGVHLFVTGTHGTGMAKVGTGLGGSLQGFLYDRNNELQTDFVAYGNGLLIARLSPTGAVSTPGHQEMQTVPFASIIDQDNFTVFDTVVMKPEDELTGNWSLIGLTSDGFYFYTVKAHVPASNGSALDSGSEPLDIYLSIYEVSKSEDGKYWATLVRPHILLQREIDPEPIIDGDAGRKPRLTYLAATATQPPGHPPPTPPPPQDPYADRMTSLGIHLRDLTSASYISTGTYLTIFTEYTPGSLPLPPPTSNSPILQSLNRHFGTGNTALRNPKATGTQIHICLHGPTPKYSKHPLEVFPAKSSFQRGLSTVPEVGFTYDAVNNLIWTASGNYADSWTNPGRIPLWKEKRQLLLQEDVEVTPIEDGPEIEVHKVLKHLWSHVGLQAHHFLDGGLDDSNSIFDEEKITSTWGIVRGMNLKTLRVDELTGLFVVLRSVISKVKVPLLDAEKKALTEIRSLSLSLFSDPQFTTKFPFEDASSGVYFEASKLIIQTYELLCDTVPLRHNFAGQLFHLMDNDSLDRNIANIFLTNFLTHLTKNLEDDGVVYDKGQFSMLPYWIIRKLIAEESVQKTVDIFDDWSSKEMTQAVSVPLVTPATAYITAVVNCLLKSWILSPVLNLPEHPDFPTTARQVFKSVLNNSSTVIDKAIEFMMLHPIQHQFHHFISTENILKSSILGMAVPQIFLWLSEHSSNSHCDRVHLVDQGCPVVDDVSEACVQLYVAISHLSDKMGLIDHSGGNKGDDWICHAEKVYPFQNYHFSESAHPLKENSKLRECIVFTGARRLYVKFDPRSATQYDYDKFTLYAGTGPAPNSKRIAEYGGNAYGLLNRAGSSYWARDLVKVEGDTVSYDVYIQSGKEQHMPVEALWGFAFTIIPVYDSYRLPGAAIDLLTRTQRTKTRLLTREHFFIDKLSLASVDTMSSVLGKLITGEPPTALETEMPSLFSSEIFSRFNFPNSNQVEEKEQFLLRLSSEQVMDLRRRGNSTGLPQMGSTLREMIKPEELEKLYVLAYFKCLTQPESAEGSASISPSPETQSSNSSAKTNPEVLHEMFLHVDSFIRKLISIAEIQLRFKEELDEVLQGSKELRETFIYNLNATDSASELETLALICDTTVNKDDPEKTVSDLRAIMDGFVAEGSSPQVAKVEELVESTILKLRFLLSAQHRDVPIAQGVKNAKLMVNQLHNLVFSHLTNQKATMSGILEVIKSHSLRASSRCQGLQLLLKLLECSQHNYQSVLMASLLLLRSKRAENISCSHLSPEVNDLTGRGIQTVIEIAKTNPLLHRHAIALICIIPYKREDEKMLVSSGLLQLLDELSGIQIEEVDSQKLEQRGTAESGRSMNSGTNKNTTSLAWASFQVLAYCCSSWEMDTKGSEELEWMDPEHVALPMQISLNVTNHLARATAMTQLSSSASKTRACGPIQEGMEDVLTLLDMLRSTKLGVQILRQSPCICRLLVLLLDTRQPPFIVLTIIRLLGTALPLVDTLDTTELHQAGIPGTKKKGGQASGVNVEPDPHSVVVNLLLSKLADFLVVCGNQAPVVAPTTEVDVAPELSGATQTSLPRPRTPPPVITIGQPGSSSVTKAKVLLSEQKCREKNIYLQNHDQPRNFLSGEVAAGLAAEVTKLIRQLLSGSTHLESTVKSSRSMVGPISGRSMTSADHFVECQAFWAIAVEQALVGALKPLGKLTGIANPLIVSLEAFAQSARITLAALAVLGSLDERIKIGSSVWVLGHDWSLDKSAVDDFRMEFWPTRVSVTHFCERTGIAIVKYIQGENEHRNISPASTLRVPISRLSVSKFPNAVPTIEITHTVLRDIATSLKNILVPHGTGSKSVDSPVCPLKKPLPTLNQIMASVLSNPPSVTDSKPTGNRMIVVRLVAEIRTRAAQVLSIWLKNPAFLETFLGEADEALPPDSTAALNSLNEIARDCKPSSRLLSLEDQVGRLRLLYRDCTKPPKLTSPNQAPEVKRPPTVPTSIVHPSPTTGATTSEPTIHIRLIPPDANYAPIMPILANPALASFVASDTDVSWSGSDSEDDGTSDYASPMSSRSNLPLEAEGYEGVNLAELVGSDPEESEATINIDEEDDDIGPDVEPILADSDRGAGNVEAEQAITSLPNSKETHVAETKPWMNEYSPTTILEYYLSPSTTYDVRVFTGPNPYVCPCGMKLDSELDALSDVSDRERSRAVPDRSSHPDADPEEDYHDLLLKAWETKVFPIIRRRFRNDSERRDGLEQIRNALTLGMIEIATQTVEFLYEENGGVPRDLHLPTLEEVKEEAARFTMERIKVGMHVLLHSSPTTNQKSEVQDSIVPKYGVSVMLKTFGLIGEVLDIDKTHELVLVETYVESDGILQRFWYPIKSLERLTGEKKPPPNLRTVSMTKLHSNLVALESSLTKLYCRKAYLEIMNLGFRDGITGTRSSINNFLPSSSRSISCILGEVDLGNLKILSQESFSEFPMNGDLLTCNLGYEVPSMEFLTEIGNPSVVFYKESGKLSAELRRTLRKAFTQNGAQGLLGLTARACDVIKHASHNFLCQEIPLDTASSFNVRLPNMAFSLVSVQGPIPVKKIGPTVGGVLTKDPCVHIYGSNGGDLRMWPLVCYPVATLGTLLKNTNSTYSSLNPGHGIRNRRMTAFPPVLVPTDRISCSIENGVLPGHRLQVLGIPPEFPLALLYCQELVTFLQVERSVPVKVPVYLLSILFDFVKKNSMPPLVKEWIFNLCSGILSTLPKSDPTVQEFYQQESRFVNRLFTEVVVLYEQETNLKTSLTLHLPISNITPGSIRRNTTNGAFVNALFTNTNRGARNRLIPNSQPQAQAAPQNEGATLEKSTINNTHSFPVVSSYFQSLLELCLNLSEGLDLTYSPPTLSPLNSAEPSPSATPAGSSAVVSLVESSRPGSTGPQRKGFRPPNPSPPSPRSNAWRRVGKAPVSEPKSPAGTSSPTSVKVEELKLKNCAEMKWFGQAGYALNLLKTFGIGKEDTYAKSTNLGNDVIQHCLKGMQSQTSQSRLFVIYGAPGDRSTEITVSRALNDAGGIYGNELWLSEDETEGVVEIRSLARVEEGFETLASNLIWYTPEEALLFPAVSVHRVNNELETGNRRADAVLAEYLKQKIFSPENPEILSGRATEVFSAIFTNCYIFNDSEGKFDKSERDGTGLVLLKKEHILYSTGDQNLMRKFVEAVKPSDFELEHFLQEVLKKFGRRKGTAEQASSCSEAPSQTGVQRPLRRSEQIKLAKVSESTSEKDAQQVKADDGLRLSESEFLDWCTQLAKDNLVTLWRALLETGHDIRLDRTWIAPTVNVLRMMTEGGFTTERDAALVTYVNQLASKLRLSPHTIHPHEIYLEETLFLDPGFQPLHRLPIEYVRTRFGILQHINQAVQYNLLPFVSLTFGKTTQTSIAALLHQVRHLLFYSTKEEFLHRVMHNSAHRGHELPPPEVTLDPISSIGVPVSEAGQTMFSSAICQLSQVPSQMFCVLPSTGSDPPLPIVVKFSGEEVQGIIGSFRHFLARTIQEVQEPALSFLIPCPSSAAGRNKDSLILRPGPITYGEERFLQCLGQYIGICLRSDIPIPMSLLTSTWRSFLNVPQEVNDFRDDLKEADVLTSWFLEGLDPTRENETGFERSLQNKDESTFEIMSMDGTTLLPLCPGGQNLSLRFGNKAQFVGLVKKLRQKELLSANRVTMILAGLSTILPLPTLNTFMTSDLRTKVSGFPEVDLCLLKAHTHYQMGMTESDRHIQFFWAALESMTPEELRNFVKFATNQDRLPASCPCQNSPKSPSTVHAPPFPMKLAIIDTPPGSSEEYINQRTIRVETCLFLIRMPPYTTYEATRAQLLYACNSHDDPLSG